MPTRLRPLILLLATCLLPLTGCATLTRVDGPCGTGPNARTCLGTMHKIPEKHVQKFTSGGRMAIDVVYSDTFATEVRRYMEGPLATNAHRTPNWDGLTAEGIVGGLRERLRGLETTTYGGPWGWWLNWAFDNVAKDGGTKGPIRVNRIPLEWRDSVDVGGTIVHEGAHRAGMKHTEGRKECGPPYVIQTLFERLVEGVAWTYYPAGHCGSFAPAAGAAPQPGG